MTVLCACGCGQPTNIAQETRFYRGTWYIKGRACRWIKGHQFAANLPRLPLPASVPVAALARQLKVDRRQVYRWRDYGVTVDQADRIAGALGRHPSEMFDGWWEVAS